MMMRKYITLVTMFVGFFLYGQQREQYSNYIMNNFVINPAVGGSHGYWGAKMGYRKQWVGLDNGPQTYFLSFHGPLGFPDRRRRRDKSKVHHGVGGYVFHDDTGPISYNGAFGSYSVHVPVSKKSILSFGLFAGLKEFRLNGNSLKFVETPIDPLIASDRFAALVPDANAGLWWYSDQFFLGGSLNQILRSKIDFNDDLQEQAQLKWHYFVTGGYRFDLSRKVIFYPSVLLKALHPAPLAVDVNARFIYDEKLWGSLSYRHRNAVALVIGYVYEDFLEIGYSYDVMLNRLAVHTKGSHEIIVGVRWANVAKSMNCPAQFW